MEWLAEQGAGPGAVIQLDLPELGASGPAEVVAILPCPEIESGPGRVVTATFHHASGDIYNLRITVPSPDGSSEPITETIGVTGHHPFWSDTRHAWIPARSLRPEEMLGTLDDPAQMALIALTDQRAPVYNIELDVDHVYRVGESGVLVHNVSEGISTNPWNRWQKAIRNQERNREQDPFFGSRRESADAFRETFEDFNQATAGRHKSRQETLDSFFTYWRTTLRGRVAFSLG